MKQGFLELIEMHLNYMGCNFDRENLKRNFAKNFKLFS